LEKSFLQKNGKNFLQKFGRKNFFTKKLAKLLKQKHTNNFLKTFFLNFFLKTNIFVKSKKVLYILHKKEKILVSPSSGRSRRPGDASASTTAAVSHASGEPVSSSGPLRPRCRSPRLEEARLRPHPRRRFPRAGAR
jgi:hypothetical protein